MTVYYNDAEKAGFTLKEAFEAEIECLMELLSEGVVNVTFKKLDGKERTLRATTNLELIGDYEFAGLPASVVDERYVRVYDLDDKGWKTFYKENVINYGFHVPGL